MLSEFWLLSWPFWVNTCDSFPDWPLYILLLLHFALSPTVAAKIWELPQWQTSVAAIKVHALNVCRPFPDPSSLYNNNNSRLFMAPHLVRAWSAYKDIRIYANFTHTLHVYATHTHTSCSLFQPPLPHIHSGPLSIHLLPRLDPPPPLFSLLPHSLFAEAAEHLKSINARVCLSGGQGWGERLQKSWQKAIMNRWVLSP